MNEISKVNKSILENILLPDNGIFVPDTLGVDGSIVKLIKENKDETDE